MAKQARGYRGQTVMGFEEDYGVIPDPAAGWIIPFNTEAVAIARPKNTAATLRGTRNPAEPFDGNTDVTGDIVVPVDANSFGLWLRALFGAPTTTEDSVSGTYSHVFRAGEEMPSIWLQTRFATDTPFYKVSTGVKINSFSLEAGGDQELTATLSTMGGVQRSQAASVVASPSDLGLDRISNFMATLKMSGTEYGDATSFSVQLDNGLDGDTYTLGGGGFRGDLSEGLMGVSGAMTVLLKDETLYKKALESTPLSLELVFSKANGSSLAFDLPKTQLQVSGPVTDGPAGLRVTWNYQAYSVNPEDAAIVATLTNTIADYGA